MSENSLKIPTSLVSKENRGWQRKFHINLPYNRNNYKQLVVRSGWTGVRFGLKLLNCFMIVFQSRITSYGTTCESKNLGFLCTIICMKTASFINKANKIGNYLLSRAKMLRITGIGWMANGFHRQKWSTHQTNRILKTQRDSFHLHVSEWSNLKNFFKTLRLCRHCWRPEVHLWEQGKK